jgi:DNA-directed RNA polymerase specialized sigma24 family protein
VARVERQEQDDLHRRVLNRDPTAKADVFETLLDPLIDSLGYRWPGLRGEDQLRDNAIDSVFNYLAAPERYDPKRCSLLTYLRMDAHNDLINAYRSPAQAVKVVPLPEESHSGVRDGRRLRKVDSALISTDSYPSDSPLAGLVRQVVDAFPDKHDREIVTLLMQGQRSTTIYAQVLGLSGLSASEQEKRVNREKDRIRKRLRRIGERYEKEHGA